jgi:predicted dehydrogenase
LLSGDAGKWADEKLGAQLRYTRDFADWLDGGAEHPCNINQAYNGYEAVEAICLSALDHTRVDLPLRRPAGVPVLERMQAALAPVERRVFR